MKLFILNSLIFFGILFATPSLAQILEESGTIEYYVDDLVRNMPGEDSNEFNLPSSSDVSNWNTFFLEMAKENFAKAATLSTAVGYEVVKFTDLENTNIYYIARRSSQSSNWWGTYFFNPRATRPNLVFEAPHAIKDFNTGKESAMAFKKLSAWSFSITGAHRCNNSILGTCDGTTQVCSGGNTNFRISDMAHTVEGILYLSAILIDDHKNNLIQHIQLHGFGRKSGDPAFILSNGVTVQPSGEDLLQFFANNLMTVDASYTSEVAHKNPNIKLKGTSNTIGRWLNASTDPCNESASNNSARFFHFEQALEEIRDEPVNWLKVIQALEMTFPSNVVAALEADSQEIQVEIFPSPSVDFVTINYQLGNTDRFKRSIMDMSGKVLLEKAFENNSKVSFSERIEQKLPTGLYILRIESESEIKSIKFIQN